MRLFPLLLSCLGAMSILPTCLPGQVPISSPSTLPSALPLLPAGPPVGDWQPRNRAVIGGTIVITGSNFRPADLVVVIASDKKRLPVRVASSTSSRIEVDVPDDALGRTGTLAVGYAGTQATVLDETYLIDMPRPSLIDAEGPVIPRYQNQVVFRIREFPGTRVDVDNIGFSGSTCGFHKARGINYGSATRAADLTMRIAFQGWFENSGSCEVKLTMNPVSASGTSTGTLVMTAPITVNAPTRYAVENTGVLIDLLKPKVVHNGAGSVCQANSGDWPGGQAVGVTTVSSDMQVLIRGNINDVSCHFQSEAWLMPHGVRIAEIEWYVNKNGNRCGAASTISSSLPGVEFTLARGSIEVRPSAGQSPSDFMAFGDNKIEVDGVTFASNLTTPRTLFKSLYFPEKCASMAAVFHDANGTYGPTTDPQSYGVVLRRIVFTGPPGKSISDILR